jgi:hypothetical protein
MNQIDKLLAIEEIKQLKARYFRFVDTKDWTAFAGLFAADAVFDLSDDLPGCVLVGLAKISELPARSLEGATTVHHGHCSEITITSQNSASGIWAMEDRVRWAEESSSPIRSLHGFGHYLETYECIEGRWQIKTLKLRRLRVDLEHKSSPPYRDMR